MGKHLSNDGYKQLVSFSSSSENSIPEVSISPNSNKTFNLSSIIPSNHTEVETTQPIPSPVTEMEANPPPIPSPPPPISSPPPPAPIWTFGVLDANGVMSDDFEVGDFEDEAIEDSRNKTEILELRVNVFFAHAKHNPQPNHSRLATSLRI